VSCHAELACPAPLLQAGGVPAPQCSGRGICAAPSAAFLSAARVGNAAAAGNRSSISANDLLDSRANVTQQGTAAGQGGNGSNGGSDGRGASCVHSPRTSHSDYPWQTVVTDAPLVQVPQSATQKLSGI
jgi:hypothetical protein